jgi:hypothetical protein
MIKKGLLTKHGKPNESTPQDWIKQEKLVFLIIPILFAKIPEMILNKTGFNMERSDCMLNLT